MSQKVIIIAEAGVNHNGSLEIAKKLIQVAAASGADYVKFQTFQAEKLVSASAGLADYQKKNLSEEIQSQYDMLKRLEMPREWIYILKDYSKECGIEFLSTGFDEESIDELDDLGLPFFKIPSGELTNKPFLQHVASKFKPVVISTGMATIEEVIDAVDVFKANGLSKELIQVLHCNTEYPTPMNDVNLLAMKRMQQELDIKVGYSDHTLGIEVSIAAVALGATLIEKHFTLSRQMEGPDHSASLEPSELVDLVAAIRNIEMAIGGSGIKKPSMSELKNRDVARKSIHINRDVLDGATISRDDLIMLRPGIGISPMKIDEVIGKRSKHVLKKGKMLSFDDFE